MADATAAFNARDAGGAGRLAPAEMRAALAAFGVELSDAEHTLLFPPPPAGDAAAAGGDAAAATVDYAEFVRHYRCRPPPVASPGRRWRCVRGRASRRPSSVGCTVFHCLLLGVQGCAAPWLRGGGGSAGLQGALMRPAAARAQ